MKKNTFFSSQKIVNEIEKSLKNRHFLYEKYLEDNAMVNLDPVLNNEFLLEGWSENIIHRGEMVRATSDAFSFIINLQRAKKLIISAAIKEKDSYSNPVVLVLKAGKKNMGSLSVKYTNFRDYTFNIPQNVRKRSVLLRGFLKKNRKSTLVIRSIRTYETLRQFTPQDEIYQEIENIRKETDHFLQILDWHKNPEHLLPAAPSDRKKVIKRFIKKIAKYLIYPFQDSPLIKKIVLRLIRPFTTPQIAFNNHLLDVLKLQKQHMEKLEKIIIADQQRTKIKKR